jgi:hypothetical protein
MIRRAVDFIAITLVMVLVAPVLFAMLVYDAGCAVRNWIVYGNTWGNWRDRV